MNNAKTAEKSAGAKTAQAKTSQNGAPVKETRTPKANAKTTAKPKEPKKLSAGERVERLTELEALARKLKTAKERKAHIEQFLQECWEDDVNVQFKLDSVTIFDTSKGDLAEEAAKCVLNRVSEFISETETEIEAFEI